MLLDVAVEMRSPHGTATLLHSDKYPLSGLVKFNIRVITH